MTNKNNRDPAQDVASIVVGAEKQVVEAYRPSLCKLSNLEPVLEYRRWSSGVEL
jgi:hypothetical protein